MSEQHITGDVLLDCFSCQHSQSVTDRTSHYPQLICAVTLKSASERCPQFQYCPGTDQGERVE